MHRIVNRDECDRSGTSSEPNCGRKSKSSKVSGIWLRVVPPDRSRDHGSDQIRAQTQISAPDLHRDSMYELRRRKEMMRRRSFIQTLAGSGAGVALLKLGTPQKRLAENASVAWTVKGFTCVTCAVGLQTILEKNEGIARLKAEYPSAKVDIGFDSQAIEPR